MTWGQLQRARRGRAAALRARPLRPPALGPLLVGHHRPAEGDRPGARRHPARAAEEAQPPPRRAARRPRLLVHDDRLDDVELPDRRAADPRLDRALRRQPRPPRHGRALGPGRAHRHHLLRHQRQLHRRLHEGRGRARRGPRPLAAALGRLHRLAALPRGLRVGLRARRRATPGSSPPAAAPTSAPPSSAASPSCPSTAASSRAAPSAPRSRPSTRTASPVIDEVGELVLTEPMPSMPVFFWGDEDGSRYRASYFEQYPGVWRHGDWIEITSRGTAIIYGRSDSTINRAGRADGHQRDLPRRPGRARGASTRWWSTSPARGPRAGCRCSSSCARAPSSTRSWWPRSSADPRAVLAPPRPERGLRDRRGPAHPARQGARGAGEADPDGRAARARRQPRLARQPRSRSTTSSSSRARSNRGASPELRAACPSATNSRPLDLNARRRSHPARAGSRTSPPTSRSTAGAASARSRAPLIPYLAIWALAILIQPSAPLAIALGLVATVFLMRMYSLFHDLTHNSLFESRRENSRWGHVLGFLLFTPYRWWQRQHALHHAHTGDLDHRGVGEINTMTVEEYESASRLRRLGLPPLPQPGADVADRPDPRVPVRAPLPPEGDDAEDPAQRRGHEPRARSALGAWA